MFFGFKPYVSVAKRRANAEKSQAKLQQKLGRPLQSVQSQGRKMVKNWWGIAWNKNLESYSDFSNRLPRGRSYLSNGSVLDLHVTAGKISALVQGSNRTPYKIEVTISPLSSKVRKHLINACAGKLQDMRQLLEGRFPEELGREFLSKGKGLFPSDKEIHFECSCPDWANLCKHVAATLYGVGVLLDTKPELLFTLRGLSLEDLVGRLVKTETAALVAKTTKRKVKAKDVLDLDDSAISKLFAIDLVENHDASHALSPKAGKAKKVGRAKKRYARKPRA